MRVKMAYVLPRLLTKKDVDTAIKSTVDKVLVLRFGRDTDSVCLQLDDTVSAQEWRYIMGISIPSIMICIMCHVCKRPEMAICILTRP